jgi:hypothetical protein
MRAGPMEKCNIYLLLVDSSNKHDLGRVNNVMVELHIVTSQISHK